jgi:hypothetical protein
MFSIWSVPRCYKEGTKLDAFSSVQESVKRGLDPETRIAIVGAATKKRLVTENTRLCCAVVNCKVLK